MGIIIYFLWLLWCSVENTLIADPEFWRDRRYLGRIENTQYVSIHIYRAISTINLDFQHPKHIIDSVLITMRTYAWHNIKILIKTDRRINIKEDDPIDLITTCRNFRDYLTNKSITKGYYMAFLFKKRNPNSKGEGRALFGAAGNLIFSTGVINIPSDDKIMHANTYAVLAHELGHAFMVEHIEPLTSNCIAYEGICVMNPISSIWPMEMPYPLAFSIHGFIQLRAHFKIFHQNDFLMKNENLAEYQICGNGIIDPGEECDCGFEANCIISGEYECCDMKTCKLKPNAECSYGECCYACKYTYKNICRESVDECDLEEYCTGNSAFCPLNKKLPDGAECDNRRAYCVGGVCPNLNKQCQTLFDTDKSYYLEECARLSEDSKIFDLTPRKENFITYSCGLLTCMVEGEAYNTYGFILSDYKGKCSYVKPTESGNYFGYIPNGRKCAENMMCLNNFCIDAIMNLDKCKNVNCVDGTVCVMGQCEGEYIHHGHCKNVICKKGHYCNKEGICSEYKIPEQGKEKAKKVTYRIIPRYKYEPNRWNFKLSPYYGRYPWYSNKTTFIHPMFISGFETDREIDKKYKIMRLYVCLTVILLLMFAIVYFTFKYVK